MRYMVERNFVLVLGNIWMPYGAKATMDYKLSSHDIANIGEFTRENVGLWLDKHAGDFNSIIDFYATVGDAEIPWMCEDNELTYQDIVFPMEE